MSICYCHYVYLLPSTLVAIAGIIGSHLFELQLFESLLIQPLPQLMIFIDILLCIKWKVFCFVYK